MCMRSGSLRGVSAIGGVEIIGWVIGVAAVHRAQPPLTLTHCCWLG